jgi:WD40 repeat protein
MQVCSFKPPEKAVHLIFSTDSRHILMDAHDRSILICAILSDDDTEDLQHPDHGHPGAPAHSNIDRKACRGAGLCKMLLRQHLKPPSSAAAENLRLRPAFGGKNQNFVAMGSSTGSLRLWHWPSNSMLTRLGGHSAAVNCVVWSPVDTRLMVSVSDDRTVRVWTAPAVRQAQVEGRCPTFRSSKR